jgi:hypothetical protein
MPFSTLMPYDYFAYDAAERLLRFRLILRHCHAIFDDIAIAIRHFMLSPLLFIFFHYY